MQKLIKPRRMFGAATTTLAVAVFMSGAAPGQIQPPKTQTATPKAQTQAPQDDSATLKDFATRVDNYIKLQKDQGGASPSKPTSSSTKIKEGQHSLADKIRAARPDAKQGDVFTPEITTVFRRLISTTLSGSQGAKIRASLRHAEPNPKFPLKVNGEFPRGVPLQSTPPTLLESLPHLPKELDYRIVGHDLVLRDVNSHLVVDFIPGAVPAP